MAHLQSGSQLKPRGGGLIGLVAGVKYPFSALWLLLADASLWPYVIGPLLINILLGLGLYSLGLWWGWRLVNRWTAQITNWIGPDWLDAVIQAIAPVIQGALVLLLSIALGFILLQFGSILGSPFYGQLSEKIEHRRAGQVETLAAPGVKGILIDLGRAVLFELKKLLLLLGGGGVLLLLNFIPAVGPLVTSIGSIGLAALIVCLDMLDAPLERRRLTFRQKLGMIRRSLPASASFALICLVLVSVPLMNLLAIPLCVAAGTVFFCDRILSLPPR